MCVNIAVLLKILQVINMQVLSVVQVTDGLHLVSFHNLFLFSAYKTTGK